MNPGISGGPASPGGSASPGSDSRVSATTIAPESWRTSGKETGRKPTSPPPGASRKERNAERHSRASLPQPPPRQTRFTSPASQRIGSFASRPATRRTRSRTRPRTTPTRFRGRRAGRRRWGASARRRGFPPGRGGTAPPATPSSRRLPVPRRRCSRRTRRGDRDRGRCESRESSGPRSRSGFSSRPGRRTPTGPRCGSRSPALRQNSRHSSHETRSTGRSGPWKRDGFGAHEEAPLGLRHLVLGDQERAQLDLVDGSLVVVAGRLSSGLPMVDEPPGRSTKFTPRQVVPVLVIALRVARNEREPRNGGRVARWRRRVEVIAELRLPRAERAVVRAQPAHLLEAPDGGHDDTSPPGGPERRERIRGRGSPRRRRGLRRPGRGSTTSGSRPWPRARAYRFPPRRRSPAPAARDASVRRLRQSSGTASLTQVSRASSNRESPGKSLSASSAPSPTLLVAPPCDQVGDQLP